MGKLKERLLSMGLEEKEMSEFVQEVLVDLMQEENLLLKSAITTLASYWGVKLKEVRSYLRDTKFDPRRNNYFMAVISDEDITSSRFNYISSALITKMVRQLVDQLGYDVYDASAAILDHLELPQNNKNFGVIGRCLRARMKIDANNNVKIDFWQTALGPYKRKMSYLKKHGVDLQKVLGSKGCEELGFVEKAI